MPAFPFLRLPLSLRQTIYSYLLPPHPSEDGTTINYSLEWPFLENPRNSTFTPHQLDICRCPQQQPRSSNIRTTDHIYTRYTCQGPDVRFTAKGGDLWLLMKPNGVFNILHPASDSERYRRPDAAIVLVSRLVYKEALPFLYKNRNFLFLTGPCPRGRYQAYATRKWLSTLSPYARTHITDLSLICQVWEEDCRARNSIKAYNSLSRYILHDVPNLQNLCLKYWSVELPIHCFGLLFKREGMRIFVNENLTGEGVSEYCDAESFMENYGAQSSRNVQNENHVDQHRRGSSILETTREGRVEEGNQCLDERTSEVAGNTRSFNDSRTQRKLSFEDDWVIAGPSSPASSSGYESDIWEML